MRRMPLKPVALAVAVVALSGCAIIDRLNAGQAEKEALEKEGRIAMVIGDERLQPDPSLATVPVTLPDARTLSQWTEAGSRPAKAIGHVRAADTLERAWRVRVGKGSTQRSALMTPPVASAQTIYTIDSRQRLAAFDLETGARQWTKTLESGSRRDRIGIGSGIALTEDGTRLIVASGFGFVTVLDASNGAEIWRTDTIAPMTGSPTVKDGRLFVSSNNNEVIAFDLDTGDILWSDQAIAESARVLSSPSPAAVEDIVVVPYSSGEVIAYLASNGRRLWSEALSAPGQFTPISSINDISARPVLGGGLVFAASQSGILAAIDGRTGNRVWQQPIGSTQAPALAGEFLFVIGTEGELACLNAGTGQVMWVRDLPQYRNAKNKKGRITYAGPIIASNRVLIASSRGDLLALNVQTGEEMDRLKLGDPVYIEPIVVQDKLFILTDDARLIAIR
ncbi:MAG: PQQ-binding-like beta-propeller repeat protein [Pseudomonadota bacterium]